MTRRTVEEYYMRHNVERIIDQMLTLSLVTGCFMVGFYIVLYLMD